MYHFLFVENNFFHLYREVIFRFKGPFGMLVMDNNASNKDFREW